MKEMVKALQDSVGNFIAKSKTCTMRHFTLSENWWSPVSSRIKHISIIWLMV